MLFSYRAEKLHSAKKKSSLSFLEKNPFKFDSSSSEDEADEKTERKAKKVAAGALKDEGAIGDFAQKLAEKTKSGATGDSEPFFFSGAEDARLREGAEFLRPTETMEELRTRFEEQRPVLANILKKKLRARAKRQEKMSFGSRGGSGGFHKKRKGFGTGKDRGKKKRQKKVE